MAYDRRFLCYGYKRFLLSNIGSSFFYTFDAMDEMDVATRKVTVVARVISTLVQRQYIHFDSDLSFSRVFNVEGYQLSGLSRELNGGEVCALFGARFHVDFAASLYKQQQHHPRSPSTYTYNAHDIKDITLAAKQWPTVPAFHPTAAMPPCLVFPPHKKDVARPARPFIHHHHRRPRSHHLQPSLLCAKCLPHTLEVPAQGRPATPPAHTSQTHRLRFRKHTIASRSATSL